MEYNPSKPFPEIEAVSEKQKKYASDLRNNYVNSKMSVEYNRFKPVRKQLNYDENAISAAFKKQGYNSWEDYASQRIEKDDTIQYLMNEKSARNIIDRLR